MLCYQYILQIGSKRASPHMIWLSCSFDLTFSGKNSQCIILVSNDYILISINIIKIDVDPDVEFRI